MKILLCSSEVVPFAKTGGLADVTGALPLALEKLGIEVRVIMPRYKLAQNSKFRVQSLKDGISYSYIGKKIIVYFIENDKYFNRDGLYGDIHGDYRDNLDRFSFFCKKILDLLKEIDFKPDIIHSNDWQTALVPIYLKALYRNDPFYQDIKTVLTIHNLAYQGLFPKEEFPKSGLSWDLFNIEGLEFYGKINLLKGGIIFSDCLTTVSPTYSKEIQTKEFGCGLEGVLAKRRDCLFGILNGIDYDIWDPSKDKLIEKNFSLASFDDKYFNKIQLQSECNLKVQKDIPLIGFISRLAEQKGIDLLAASMEQIYKMELQFVLLGTGDEKYHIIFEKVAKRYSKEISINLKYDDRLAHKIYAGSDMFLMPSRYEPCGLGQLISLKYGTIPIIYKTGGLADTISSYETKSEKGNGFVFDIYSREALLSTIEKATSVYKDRIIWQRLARRAMEYDFSWEASAKKYIELYKRCLSSA